MSFKKTRFGPGCKNLLHKFSEFLQLIVQKILKHSSIIFQKVHVQTHSGLMALKNYMTVLIAFSYVLDYQRGKSKYGLV